MDLTYREVIGERHEMIGTEETRQIYRCAGSPYDKLTIVCSPDDDHLCIEASVADSFYLTRNQVRGLMHQLTDWLT